MSTNHIYTCFQPFKRETELADIEHCFEFQLQYEQFHTIEISSSVFSGFNFLADNCDLH